MNLAMLVTVKTGLTIVAMPLHLGMSKMAAKLAQPMALSTGGIYQNTNQIHPLQVDSTIMLSFLSAWGNPTSKLSTWFLATLGTM